MHERLPLLLDSLLEAASNAVEFTIGMSLDTFRADDLRQAAVMMCFIRMGEAAARIAQWSPDFVSDHRGWPWSDIRAVRNMAAHAYEEVDFDRIWKTVREDLPLLIVDIEALGPLDPRT